MEFSLLLVRKGIDQGAADDRRLLRFIVAGTRGCSGSAMGLERAGGLAHHLRITTIVPSLGEMKNTQ